MYLRGQHDQVAECCKLEGTHTVNIRDDELYVARVGQRSAAGDDHVVEDVEWQGPWLTRSIEIS